MYEKLDNSRLEDRICVYLQEIYSNLNEFYECVKNNKEGYVITNMGVDGFESNLIFSSRFSLKVTDRYSNMKFFTYKNKKGEIFLPSNLDSIFYASRVILNGNNNEFVRELGVKNMKSDEIIRFIESVHDEVILLNLNKGNDVKKKTLK